jgi:hypothetical protein
VQPPSFRVVKHFFHNKAAWDPKPCLLAADGGVHPLDDPVDGISSHHKGVMLQDAVDIEALY